MTNTSVIIYRSAIEQRNDMFWVDHPELQLILIAVGLGIMFVLLVVSALSANKMGR